MIAKAETENQQDQPTIFDFVKDPYILEFLQLQPNATLCERELEPSYPLKFLFGLMFSDNTYIVNGQAHEMMRAAQTPALMTIYGAGFSTLYLLFLLMYLNAKKRAKTLSLTSTELFVTNTQIYINIICGCIGITSIALAWLLPARIAGCSGFIYCGIAPAYYILYSYRGRRQRKLYGV